jgi:hypothetical protein
MIRIGLPASDQSSFLELSGRAHCNKPAKGMVDVRVNVLVGILIEARRLTGLSADGFCSYDPGTSGNYGNICNANC